MPHYVEIKREKGSSARVLLDDFKEMDLSHFRFIGTQLFEVARRVEGENRFGGPYFVFEGLEEAIEKTQKISYFFQNYYSMTLGEDFRIFWDGDESIYFLFNPWTFGSPSISRQEEITQVLINLLSGSLPGMRFGVDHKEIYKLLKPRVEIRSLEGLTRELLEAFPDYDKNVMKRFFFSITTSKFGLWEAVEQYAPSKSKRGHRGENGKAAQHVETSVITLSESVMAKSMGKSSSVEGVIVGAKEQPFLAVEVATLECSRDQECCTRCGVPLVGHCFVGSRNPEVVLAVLTAKDIDQTTSILKKKFWTVPKECKANRVFLEEQEQWLQVVIQPSEEELEGGYRRNMAYIATHEIEMMQTYQLLGTTTAHPKTMKATNFVRKAIRVGRKWEVYEGNKDELEVFRGDPETKIKEIFEELNTYVNPLRGRNLESIAYALPWFSPIGFLIGSEPIRRGTLNVLAFGDTGQGKTDLFHIWNKHFGEWGHYVNCENASFAGLVAGMQRVQDEFVPVLGELPRRDGTLILLDEYHSADKNIRKNLSGILDTGNASLVKVGMSIEAKARLRIILGANPISSNEKSLRISARAHGVQHIPYIMSSPEDCRRLDYAICFSDSEEVKSKMHRGDIPKPPHGGLKYSKSRFENLIHFIWSRRPAQCFISDKVFSAGQKIANAVSSQYSTAIPIIDRGDSVKKICRIGMAVASLTFSERDDNIEVKEEHLEWSASLLRKLYDGEDMGFLDFSQGSESEEISMPEAIAMRDKLENSKVSWDLYDILKEGIPIGMSVILSMTNHGDQVVRKAMNTLRINGWIKATGFGIKATPKGLRGIKMLLRSEREAREGKHLQASHLDKEEFTEKEEYEPPY